MRIIKLLQRLLGRAANINISNYREFQKLLTREQALIERGAELTAKINAVQHELTDATAQSNALQARLRDAALEIDSLKARLADAPLQMEALRSQLTNATLQIETLREMYQARTQWHASSYQQFTSRQFRSFGTLVTL